MPAFMGAGVPRRSCTHKGTGARTARMRSENHTGQVGLKQRMEPWEMRLVRPTGAQSLGVLCPGDRDRFCPAGTCHLSPTGKVWSLWDWSRGQIGRLLLPFRQEMIWVSTK